jgi:hypothetical protein
MQRVVDVHTHVFNARYLPLHGLLKEKYLEDLGLLGDTISKALAELINEMVRPGPLLEIEEINGYVQKIKEASSSTNDLIDFFCNQVEKHTIERLSTKSADVDFVLEDDPYFKAINRLEEIYQTETPFEKLFKETPIKGILDDFRKALPTHFNKKSAPIINVSKLH